MRPQLFTCWHKVNMIDFHWHQDCSNCVLLMSQDHSRFLDNSLSSAYWYPQFPLSCHNRFNLPGMGDRFSETPVHALYRSPYHLESVSGIFDHTWDILLSYPSFVSMTWLVSGSTRWGISEGVMVAIQKFSWFSEILGFQNNVYNLGWSKQH